MCIDPLEYWVCAVDLVLARAAAFVLEVERELVPQPFQAEIAAVAFVLLSARFVAVQFLLAQSLFPVFVQALAQTGSPGCAFQGLGIVLLRFVFCQLMVQPQM